GTAGALGAAVGAEGSGAGSGSVGSATVTSGTAAAADALLGLETLGSGSETVASPAPAASVGRSRFMIAKLNPPTASTASASMPTSLFPVRLLRSWVVPQGSSVPGLERGPDPTKDCRLSAPAEEGRGGRTLRGCGAYGAKASASWPTSGRRSSNLRARRRATARASPSG